MSPPWLLVLSCLITTAFAGPAPGAWTSTSSPSPTCTSGGSCGHGKVLTLQELQARQPLNGLPSNSDATLLYSALGIGHQNYTCNGTAYVQTEAGDGASALLYDTTQFLEHNAGEIKRFAQACNFKGCKYPEILDNLLGDHYFSALLQPTFNLTKADPPVVMSGVKSATAPSPKPDNNVLWLYLTANTTNGISHGLTEVYRIDTYRGVAPTSCDKAGTTASIPYTAQYWFYD